MIKNIKNSYKIFVILVIFLALIFPNIILALGPETKDASGITKEQAYLNGYYYDTNGGVFGSNKTEYVNFAYSKNATTKCTDLYLNGNKTTLLEVKPIKSSYSSLVARLENETDYYFCFILYELNYGGIGGNKTYKPVAYGNVLSFKTLKGFVSKPTKTPTSGITKRTVGPDKIGNVSTYEASRTTDIEALFSGDVDRLDGEAHAYFRYAILDKPPIFCNDIYGSAQRSAVATNPNPYGRIGVLSSEAEIRKAIENLKNQTKTLWLKALNSQPYNIIKLAGDSKAKAPNINGYYTRYDQGGIITIVVDKVAQGNKFPDFTYSGIVSGKGNVGTPTQLGNTGLEIDFYSFTYQSGTQWQLFIPNTSSPEYLKNLNAYNQNLLDIKNKEIELDNFLKGVGKSASFSTVVSKLSPDTTYYYCAIVSNNAINPTEIEYGPVKSFRTLPCQTCPQTTITTNNPYNIGSNSATLNGAFSTIPQVDTYFEYKKESDIEWKKTPSESHAQRSYGKFNTLITSLTKATVYQFRAVGEATTVGKTGGSAPTSKIFYGDTISFKTTSGNLFDSFGWTQEPFDDSTGGDDYDEVDEDQNDGTDGTCFDGIKNGDETGIDTGGRCGKKGPNPDNPFDCEPNCDIVIPPLPTCFDGIQNGNETGIDTGGWCGDGSNGTCFDGIKNGDETGIDTGGRCYIPPLPTCFDGIKNGNETGIDTGGWCGNGTPGNGNCFDGIKNGDETGIDTGGRCYIKNPGGNVIVIGPGGTVKNNGGTTISSGGTTIISGGNTTTKGGTTTISGGTTSINGQNTNINNGIATNTGGTATTNGGTTTLRGGTTTITFKDANGNTQTFITNSEVKISRNGDTSVVTFKDANGNTQTVVIRDGEGQVVNVGGVSTTENGSTVLTGGNTNVLDNRSGPKLGDRLTPPSDAIVRYHEGIETVFTRQIMKNLSFARLYGYSDGDNLQNFADTLSHTFAKEYFGYIDATGLEVRVSKPDVSAYELRQIGGVLTVYEYYENVIVDIRNTTTIFKNKNPYEYYDRRRR